MKKLLFVLLLLALVVASGCGEPKLDGTTDETIQKSLKKMRQSLSGAELENFDEAYKFMSLQAMNLEGVIFRGEDGSKGVDELRKRLDGKTAVEVIAEAEVVRKEQAEKKRLADLAMKEQMEKERKEREAKLEAERKEQEERERQERLEAERREREKLAAQRLEVTSKIAEFEAMVAEGEKTLEQLKDIKVTKAGFEMTEDFLGKKPVIEVGLSNATRHVVATVGFLATVRTPDRPEPWLETKFSIDTDEGGMKPGDTFSAKLAPSRFSDWGKLDFPAGTQAELDLKVIGIEGPGGKTILQAKILTAKDMEKFKEGNDAILRRLDEREREIDEKYGTSKSGEPQ